jgi:hypothetical protein
MWERVSAKIKTGQMEVNQFVLFCCPFSTIFELIYYGFKAAGKYCGLKCYASDSNYRHKNRFCNFKKWEEK